MIRIVNVNIKRFRSIIELNLPVYNGNMVSICGQNNVGKTNTLRAINLFFYPELYNAETDMPKIKRATGGQSIYPKIEIIFYDESLDRYYAITRDIKLFLEDNDDLKGTSYQLNGKKKTGKVKLSTQDIREVLENIEFVYIESINVMIPELIESLTEDMLDVQYNKSRFSKSKKALKESYDEYVKGLGEILEAFAAEISDVFKWFQSDWSVNFVVPSNSNTVRELISSDVLLTLDDKGSQGVSEKGAGLQRLATILLTFEMLARMKKKKSIIICIDEPDIYLHEGLQQKLKAFFDEKSQNMQLFYTTHSKVFIDIYSMKNVFLLESKLYKQFSVRKNKNVMVTETYIVDIDEKQGYDKICNHLGIERLEYELLETNNILVEGACDKKYLEELGKFFGIKVPHIEVLNGADQSVKYLEFYESYYKNNTSANMPRIKLLLDNDSKGREVYQKVASKRYNNISVKPVLLTNYLGNSNTEVTGNTTNNEIEDFIYPELICYLINALLRKRGMNPVNSKSICKKIETKAFAAKGILELCEHDKNSKNPENGADISFVSSGNITNRIKEGLAGLFSLEANKKLISLLTTCAKKYPTVKSELINLCDFDEF